MSAEHESTVARARERFRRDLEEAGGVPPAERLGRIAVVLSGGGAFGAYQAGALLAFQDAALPTPIMTATSIGGINAASYAAHSSTEVGNAEPLVAAWLRLSSPAVGIEWTRYAWMLAGLVAAATGFGGLAMKGLERTGFSLHLHHPVAAWLTLGMAGAAVLLLYDHLPYLFRAVAATRRNRLWRHQPRRLALSVLANALVLAFFVAILDPLHLHAPLLGAMRRNPLLSTTLLIATLLLIVAGGTLRRHAGRLAQRLLRLPLRPGLFSNFERARLLGDHIPVEALRASPIRLLVTVTDLGAGIARYFSNAPPERLAEAPGADRDFVASSVHGSADLLPAILASSAVPMVFEPVVIDGRAYADGAIAATRPLLPAVQLGADVIFVLNLDALAARRAGGNTFVDIGLQALALMMSWALVADVDTVERVNAWCHRAAVERGLSAEQVTLDFDGRRFRHVKLFRIQPAGPLRGAVLDFGGVAAGEALLRGYLDASAQVLELCTYARRAKLGDPRQVVAVTFEQIRSAAT